jgi:Glycosyltransferase family 87
MTPTLTPVNDFSLYWVAAKQLLAGQNSYIPATGSGLVHSFSIANHEPLVMFGPPWTFPVIFWLGFLPFQLAQFAWLLVLAGALSVAMVWLWQLYGEGRSLLWAGVLTVSFLPVLATFLLAQIGPLLLLGIAGFLRYEEKRPYLAGAFLYLVALKPHVALLLWPALLLWALRGSWKPLVGFFMSFGAANLFALALRPTIFRDYWAMLQEHRVAFYDTPTIGAILRHASGHELLQYLPAALALLWLLWYWVVRRRDVTTVLEGQRLSTFDLLWLPFREETTTRGWEWKTELPLLLLISVAAAPYSWFSDQIILIPALFDAARRVAQRDTLRIFSMSAAYVAVNFAALVMVLNRQVNGIAGIALVWLAFYGIIALAQGHKLTGRDPVSSLPAH